MTSGETQSNKFNQLRQQAENFLHEGGLDNPRSLQDIESLLHELQVHQVELEMQNEELRRAQKELEASREQYTDLYDFAPTGYFTLDRNGMIQRANLTGAGWLGIERTRLVKTLFTSYIAPESLPVFRAHLSRAFQTGERQTCEVQCRGKGGEVFLAQLDSLVVDTGAEAGAHCRTTVSDITQLKRAEESLRESEERFRVMANAIPQLAWIAKADGYIFWFNRRWYEYTGTTPEQMEGWGWQDIHDPQVLPQVIEQWKTSIATGKPFDMVFPLRGADGRFRPFLTRVMPLKDRLGRVVQWFGTNTDITEHKQTEDALRASEERFHAAFENGAIAMALTAPNTTFLQVNPAFCRMLGFSEAEMVGRPFTDFTHPEDVAGNLAGTRQMLNGEASSFRMEKRYIRKDGQVIWGDMCTAPVRDAQGRPIYYVTHVQDITERKRAEAALREANERLSDADRRKDEFLAMLAHELRNPLAPIRNAVQILRYTGTDEQALQRQRNIIDRQVAHMARLLDDLLDVSRITSGKIVLKCQPLHLTDVLAHAVETATPLIESRHHTLNVSMPPDALRVEGDIDRLAQSIGNLLANAAKYTAEGGQIWLEGSAEGAQAVVRVRDTGAGISPEMLPCVFDLFTQADQTLGRSQGGLGIGLTMVKKLIELHGGTVEARSEGLGHGSEFLVRLPALPQTQSQSAGDAGAQAVPAASSSRRVLVVEDVPDTAASLGELLELWGHQVRVVHDGPEALETAPAFAPEVVLLDIGLPLMDGYEVARRLRQESGLESARLVALTGYAQDTDRLLAREAGFDDHLVKPVDLELLRELLAKSSIQS